MKDETSIFDSFSFKNNDIHFQHNKNKPEREKLHPYEIVNDPNNPKFRIVQKLVFENPALVDYFLTERDPEYSTYDDDRKDKLRNCLPYLKPYDIYERYMKWIDEEE